MKKIIFLFGLSFSLLGFSAEASQKNLNSKERKQLAEAIKVEAYKFADNPSEWWIDITIKDRNSRSPKKYTGKEIWPKVYELYKFYYDKHRRSV